MGSEAGLDGCRKSRFSPAFDPQTIQLVAQSLYRLNIPPHDACLLYGDRDGDRLRTELSGDRIPVDARFSVPVQTGLETHPTSCKGGRGLELTTHPLLVPRLRMVWSYVSVCPLCCLGISGVTFTFYLFYCP